MILHVLAPLGMDDAGKSYACCSASLPLLVGRPSWRTSALVGRSVPTGVSRILARHTIGHSGYSSVNSTHLAGVRIGNHAQAAGQLGLQQPSIQFRPNFCLTFLPGLIAPFAALVMSLVWTGRHCVCVRERSNGELVAASDMPAEQTRERYSAWPCPVTFIHPH